MFRKSVSMITAWENNGNQLFADLQRSILDQVVTMLKPGGMLLYSTCTFAPLENEQSIEYLLSLDDRLELDCVVITIDIVILIHCWISIHINILGCNLSICEELLCPLLACNKTSLTM